MKNLLLCGLVLLSLAPFALADIPPAKKTKSIDTTLWIGIKKDAKEARLIIPRSQLQELKAELEQLDSDSHTAWTVGTTQTIVSGTLLSLALVFGGLWFVRSGAKRAKPVAAAAVLLAFGSAATFVYANAGPPPEARSITGKMFTQAVHIYKQGSGKIKLEVSDDAQFPQLIVPDVKDNAEE